MSAPHDDDPSENSALPGLRGVGRSAAAARPEAVDAAQAPAGADPAVWRSIEAEVMALLADDPILADLLRP